MRKLRTLTLVLAGPFALALLTGCGDSSAPVAENPSAEAPHSESHDHDDVHITAADVERPANFAAGVSRISDYRDAIRDSIAAGRPTKAHRPLDEANFVLEWLPELARESGVPKEHWEDINAAIQTLRSSFDQVHANIDEKNDPGYAAVSKQVDEAIASLESIAQETRTPTGDR